MGFGHDGGDVLPHNVQGVARVIALKLAEGQAVVTETGFESHLPALPPARQIDDLRPAERDNLLRDFVGNGTHGALSVVFARGTHSSTREHSGREPRMAMMGRFIGARESRRQVAMWLTLTGVPVAPMRWVLTLATSRDSAAVRAPLDHPQHASDERRYPVGNVIAGPFQPGHGRAMTTDPLSYPERRRNETVRLEYRRAPIGSVCA